MEKEVEMAEKEEKARAKQQDKQTKLQKHAILISSYIFFVQLCVFVIYQEVLHCIYKRNLNNKKNRIRYIFFFFKCSNVFQNFGNNILRRYSLDEKQKDSNPLSSKRNGRK